MWSVELFFFFMVIHLWGKYWMSAWRGGRVRTWVTGAVTFLVAVPCALTGYVSQQNFDAQWISTQAKDGMNPPAIGAFFNVMNFGQMYSYHILLLPAGGRRAGRRPRPAGPQARGRSAAGAQPTASATPRLDAESPDRRDAAAVEPSTSRRAPAAGDPT